MCVCVCVCVYLTNLIYLLCFKRLVMFSLDKCQMNVPLRSQNIFSYIPISLIAYVF